MPASAQVLDVFHPAVREWFTAAFAAPTPPQALGWPAIARGESTLLLSPTGSGKTLAAFLACINRLMFSPVPRREARCRVLYVSPLKALATDVERNLRAPLVGIGHVADARGDAHLVPQIAVRTGDTPAKERARFGKDPTDILITTPESLYLMLTSKVRETLRSVDTVIIDEIHALVPTKRGAHLALSLERLEQLTGKPLQRIGLSATQRPLEEVARFLGGTLPRPPRAATAPQPAPAEGAPLDATAVRAEFDASAEPLALRPVTVVDAGKRKALKLRVEVPVEDMAELSKPLELPSGPTAAGPKTASIWSAIHPRLLELIRQHHSTLVFVNSRRVAERLAAALNDLAGEERLVQAHHGSIARPQRIEIEDNLKAGRIRGLVATSSLELGIDMGSVDLVVQIEAPPSVASGMQRIGRAGHQVDAPSEGVLFPKYRADLVACASLTRAMHEGEVEATRYPRNPLDVLAQQIVAMVAVEPWSVDTLFAVVRGAAPFAQLSYGIFENVLDLLSGRYAADGFADLKPRLTWDRVKGELTARDGAKLVALVNGGTIPDRGLYGVFLAGSEKKQARVGELDEEMVFECKPGETFVLGASTWRIEEITHDRVLVSPAPGKPGKLPFWHGDLAMRPLETGRRIGALQRELRAMPRAAALARLESLHDLERGAAENLLQYLDDQAAATDAVPDDRTLVIERVRDELGDWRLCVLSPLGGKVHAPWAMALTAKIKEERGLDVETMWSNDGMVVRFPGADEPPNVELLLPKPEEAERWVLQQLGGTSLFAARFRENASRSLLLPKRKPGGRTPLWQLRKRSQDLLQVASRFSTFPMLLETYRECLRDVFDLPALQDVLGSIAQRRMRVVTVDSSTPSPFASALLFSYVANFIYDGDAPLAERRAQALSIDPTQLRELLGEAELRQLLDADALAALESQLQRRDEGFRAKGADGVHDLLLRLGDLSREELTQRVASPLEEALDALQQARRVLLLPFRGGPRFVAAEDASRYRDALGLPLPAGVPEAFLRPVTEPLLGLCQRYARTHGPFTTAEVASRFGLGATAVEAALKVLHGRSRLLEGAFRPGGTTREWCDPEVLTAVRRRSLAKLRDEIEPVEGPVLGRLLTRWQGVTRRGRGLDGVLDAVERLQGCPLPASLLESDFLPARVEGYQPGDLDALAAAGEVVWVGLEPLGERDGRIALYLPDQQARLSPLQAQATDTPLSARESEVLGLLHSGGATFFAGLHEPLGGDADATVDALWSLVWRGLVTNDTFRALRAFTHPPAQRLSGRAAGRAFRSRRQSPPAAEGRWSLVPTARATPTAWSAAVAQQLLNRYGVVTREVAQSESLPGGFSAVYEVFRSLEEGGRIRRGYFVSGVGALQFAVPSVLDTLRSLRAAPDPIEVVRLAATDPANPYGALLPWPKLSDGRGLARTVGAHVVLVNGAFAAHVARGGHAVWVALPEAEPDRSQVARAIASQLVQHAHGPLLLAEVNGEKVSQHPLAPFLVESGFVPTLGGYQLTPGATPARARPHA